jgi:hypothetical protein
MLALWLPFNYYNSHAGIIVFALAYGFSSGAFVSLLMPCVAKAGSIDTLGRRFGTFQIVMSVRYWTTNVIFLILPLTYGSNLTGLPIMGAILVRQGNVDYAGLAIFGGVSSLLGCILLAGATYISGKRLSTWRV